MILLLSNNSILKLLIYSIIHSELFGMNSVRKLNNAIRPICLIGHLFHNSRPTIPN